MSNITFIPSNFEFYRNDSADSARFVDNDKSIVVRRTAVPLGGTATVTRTSVSSRIEKTLPTGQKAVCNVTISVNVNEAFSADELQVAMSPIGLAISSSAFNDHNAALFYKEGLLPDGCCAEEPAPV